MRRIGFLSDVHSNLEALTAVLRDSDMVEFRRVPSPYEETAAKLRGPPVTEETRRSCADRLAEGR
jgi:hypothetical protein